MSEKKDIVSQLYCQKAKIDTLNDRLTWRTIALVIENGYQMIYYYDGLKFINKFGPLTSATVDFQSKRIGKSITMKISQLDYSNSLSSNVIDVPEQDDISYTIKMNSGESFMTIYLKYDNYKKDPLELQKKNIKNFINKLIITIPIKNLE